MTFIGPDFSFKHVPLQRLSLRSFHVSIPDLGSLQRLKKIVCVCPCLACKCPSWLKTLNQSRGSAWTSLTPEVISPVDLSLYLSASPKMRMSGMIIRPQDKVACIILWTLMSNTGVQGLSPLHSQKAMGLWPSQFSLIVG